MKVNPWLRLWDRVLDNCKAQSLPVELFRGWINLLCLANRQDNRGRLPDNRTIAFALRITMAQASKLVNDLRAAGFIDPDNTMHDWDEWQPDEKSNAQRSREWRNERKKRALAERSRERSNERFSSAPDIEGEIEEEEEGECASARARDSTSPPSPSLGPEYTAVGEYAIQLGADVSWGEWVRQMGIAGHSAADIRAALDESAGAGKLKQPYVASKLRGWATEGRPKPSRRNGRDPAPVEYPPIDPEKLKPKPIRIHDRMTADIREKSMAFNRRYGFPESGVIE